MFTQSERESIIKEYLSGGYTKNEIWKKYTGQELEKSQLLRWMRQLGYISKEKRHIHVKLASKHKFKRLDSNEESFNTNELQNRIKELEKELLEEKIKSEGYQLMIDIAEKELKIPIRKKSNTK
jgi:transposase-like protein